MLFHPDGRTLVAATPEEHDALAREDWGTVPQTFTGSRL